ncbi:hypothetical protein PMSD_13790 [Paenibacillus macquariensis subsp. defensor]|nr:hypothetical protein PMSD_13790 [Paenibacillus macquariensis subsp. defensor]
MPKVMNLRDIRDTKLWNSLSSGFKGNDLIIATALAQNVVEICEELSQRVKGFYSLHPQYTLHDETHFLRVTELMSLIIPDETLYQLNPVEVALLIYSAYFHDQGMILTGQEIGELDTNKDFLVFKDNWLANYPNYTELIESSRTKVGDEYEKCIQLVNELRSLMLTDYVRVTHGKRSATFVKYDYATDKRLEVSGVNLSDMVASLCWSHVHPVSSLVSSKGYYLDETVGNYTVNLQYIAIILRLADILDFDRDRTPEALYRTIHFSNDVSIKEWEKHRSVDGWLISEDLIRFTIKCEHPIYQKTAIQFMDWIDEELISSHNLVNQFPKAIADKYKLLLPVRVDRSRIEPRGNAYTYYDLEFSLSRDAVVKLLMTDRLYDSPSLCIRELLQNSLDALRHRKALIKRDNGTDFSAGQIFIEHSVDEEGYEVLRCTDNGVGMNEEIIQKFLTKAGTSYYHSSEFLQEKNSFVKANVDFDPCGQFGIGFMSCFMFGDRIKIFTRLDRGPNSGYDHPIILEINGLGGIVVIKTGNTDQPVGTTVEITGRKKPRFLDETEDILKLIDYVSTVCVATEYPIIAQCSIPEIEKYIKIEPDSIQPATYLELAGLTSIKTYYQSFTEIHPLLNGGIKISFLVDDNHELTLGNNEAIWVNSVKVDGRFDNIRLVRTVDGEDIRIRDISDGISLDGILVCGRHPYTKLNLEGIGIEENSQTELNDSFIVDVRGAIKPELTPARTLPNRLGEDWDHIEELIMLSHGRLWGQVIQNEMDYEKLWQLVVLNNATFSWVNSRILWKYVKVPLMDELGNYDWVHISKLGRLYLTLNNDEKLVVSTNNKEITAYETLNQWDYIHRFNGPWSVDYRIIETVISMSTVSIEEGQTFLELREPTTPEKAPFEFLLNNYNVIYTLPYSSLLNHLLSIEMPIRNVNRQHPLVELSVKGKFLSKISNIKYFSYYASMTLSSYKIISILSSNSEEVTKDMRTLGRLSESLEWAEIPKELHPPYLVWTRTHGVVSISLETLKKWAYANIISD